ncbi:hypothetical protein ACN47E_000308 [Coniothyrium glycines]
MSWTFQLENINRSFDRIAIWYKEFMHRTEQCFREFHERILVLERRQTTQGLSDEQLERVLRKILAEKFSLSGVQNTAHTPPCTDRQFVEYPKDTSCPRPVPFDPASLVVEPDSIPSKAYMDTFEMLEGHLTQFPRLPSRPAGVNGIKSEIKKPRGLDSD